MSAEGKRVLIVDDSAAVRRNVLWILEPTGLEVVEAADGKQALELLENETIDLVIADLNMPVMDGLQLIRKVRAHPKMKQLPVIMMTTETRPQDQAAAHEAGADMYLAKPSSPDVIRYKVLSLLGLRDPRTGGQGSAP